MSYQFNEQFTAASRQFADAASQINHIALENFQKIVGLQLSTFAENANAPSPSPAKPSTSATWTA